MEITYEMIKPLIKKEELMYGNQIHLEFCAKNQETATQTVAVIMAEQNEIKKNVAKEVVINSAKNSIFNQILNFIGIGGIGRSIVKSTTNDMMNKSQDPMAMIKTEITKEKKEKAIVDAFMGIKAVYKFNEQSAEWEYLISQ